MPNRTPNLIEIEKNLVEIMHYYQGIYYQIDRKHKNTLDLDPDASNMKEFGRKLLNNESFTVNDVNTLGDDIKTAKWRFEMAALDYKVYDFDKAEKAVNFLKEIATQNKTPLEIQTESLVSFLNQQLDKLKLPNDSTNEQAGNNNSSIDQLLARIEKNLEPTTSNEKKHTRLLSMKEILIATKELRTAAEGNDPKAKEAAANKYQNAILKAHTKDQERIEASDYSYKYWHSAKEAANKLIGAANELVGGTSSSSTSSGSTFGPDIEQFCLPQGTFGCQKYEDLKPSASSARPKLT